MMRQNELLNIIIAVSVGMWIWLMYLIMTKIDYDPRPGSLSSQPLPMVFSKREIMAGTKFPRLKPETV